MRVLVLSFFLSFSIVSIAQFNFTRFDEYPVEFDGQELVNAWAGGINSPQVSRIDINNDGHLDLFVFDRMGNRFMTFLNTNPTSGQISYEHTFDYNHAFPQLKNWVLMRDFNCDGAMDIFTSHSGSIRVYRNTNEDELAFELEAEQVLASYNLSGTPFEAPTYVASVDVPSIIDFDGDGDLDIFSWTELASTMYYYKNISVEESAECGLSYRTANRCYGQFSEASENSAIFYGEDFECDFNVIDAEGIINPDDSTTYRHTGGCICQIDLDNSGHLDMMIADVTEVFMTEMMMQDDALGFDEVYFTENDFPADWASTLEITLRTFPCAYYEDINNDGVNDLVVGPNTTIDSEDDNSVWLYLNEGGNSGPVFSFVQDDFLQETMIECGRGAHPVIVDWNGDGLMDIVVANKEYSQAVDQHPSQLLLLENIGTAELPAFSVVDYNWLDIPQYQLESIHPAFGDLDGDDDLDLILGEESGKMHFFENQAGPGNEMDFVLMIPGILDPFGEALDIGAFATPQLIDLSGDGLLDLIVGEKNGNVNYLENVGTESDFQFEHMIDSIGDAIASNLLGIQGYSVPWMWEDDEGNLQLILGNEVGTINHFDDIEGNLEGTFNVVEESMDDIWEGIRSGGCIYDFNNDGENDLVYGQYGGGIAFYRGGEIAPGINEPTSLVLSVFPNPSQDEFTVEIPQNSGNQLFVFNSQGRLVEQIRVESTRVVINLKEQAPGVYTVKLDDIATARVVKF